MDTVELKLGEFEIERLEAVAEELETTADELEMTAVALRALHVRESVMGAPSGPPTSEQSPVSGL